jgi:hypothetical protein
MKRFVASACLGLAVVLGASAAAPPTEKKDRKRPEPPRRVQLVPGSPAPVFTLHDLEGKVFSLREAMGRPIVIEFGSYT